MMRSLSSSQVQVEVLGSKQPPDHGQAQKLLRMLL